MVDASDVIFVNSSMFVIDRLAFHNLGKYGEASVPSCKFDHNGREVSQIKFQVMLIVES